MSVLRRRCLPLGFAVLCLMVFGAVDGSDENDRRDIHRIIIRDGSKSRGHHRYHRSRPSYHDHDSHEHYYHHDDDYHGHGHGDDSASYEDHAYYHHPKKYRRHPPHHHHHHHYDSHEDDYHHFSSPSASASSEDWTPLTTSTSPRGPSRRPPPTVKPKRLHEFVDITTQVPQRAAAPAPPPLFRPANVLRSNGMNYFNFKIAQPENGDSNYAEESRQETTSVDFGKRATPRPKSLGGGYEVYEVFEDTKSPRPPSINALSPYLVKSIPLPMMMVNGTATTAMGTKEASRLVKREKPGRKIKGKPERARLRATGI